MLHDAITNYCSNFFHCHLPTGRGTAVCLGLGDALEAIRNKSDLKAVVLSGADRAFCAGAAIDEFCACSRVHRSLADDKKNISKICDDVVHLVS